MAPKESQDDVARPAARLPGCIAASLRGWSTLTGSAAQEAPAIDFPHLEMDGAVQHVRIRAVLEFACSTSPKLAVSPPPPLPIGSFVALLQVRMYAPRIQIKQMGLTPLTRDLATPPYTDEPGSTGLRLGTFLPTT